MPKRTTSFQQIVRLIHEHLAADGAKVEESHMLVDLETGEEREVDVTLTTEVAGHKVVVAIEATERKRPADAKWVEAEIAKHRSLGTHKLVLVADKGFTPAGQAKAAATGGRVVALTPEEIEADPERAIVSRLGVVVAKTVKVLPADGIGIVARMPNGEIVQDELGPEDDAGIFDAHGNQTSTVRKELRKRIEAVANRIPEELKVSDDPQMIDKPFRIDIHDWTPTEYIEARFEDGPTQLIPMLDLVVSGRLQIEVVHVSLSHMRLGSAAGSYGKAPLASGDGLLVVTEDHEGDVRASLRSADGHIASLELDESLNNSEWRGS